MGATIIRRQPERKEDFNHLEAQNEEIAALNCLIEREFAASTTCHGIAYWSTSKYTLQKLFWILLVLGMSSVMLQQVAFRISAYYEYQSTTDVSTVFPDSIEFPAVTICNFNKYFNPMSVEERNAMRTLSRVGSFSAIKISEHSETVDLLLNDLAFFDALNVTVSSYLDKRGYKLRDRTELRQCRYGNEKCNLEHFGVYISDMGRCHTFNFNRSNTIYQNVGGVGYGLSVVLDAAQSKYVDDATVVNQEAGIRFQVHSKDVPPNVAKFGTAVPIGRKAYASVTRKDTKVMYKPWGTCDPENEKSLIYYPTYSLQACMQECYGLQVAYKCGCRPFNFQMMNDTEECTPRQMANCSTREINRAEKELSPDLCHCTVPCAFTSYDVRTSYSTLPNLDTLYHFASIFDDTGDYLEDNILALDVFFEEIAYSTETQSKKIQESALLSDIGGQLGLWIGMSVITTAEIIQYLITRIAGAVVALVATLQRRTRVQVLPNSGDPEKSAEEKSH